MSKVNSLNYIQSFIDEQDLAPEEVADKVATALYMSDIKVHITGLPEPLLSRISTLYSTT